jgi:hypothetical protein
VILRHTVCDVVVIAFIVDEDMHPYLGVGRCIEDTHGDADPVSSIGIKEK